MRSVRTVRATLARQAAATGSNLFGNAVKYNVDGGRVEINVKRCGPLLELSVTDTGIGIEAEHVGRLFRPFERLGAAARAREGTGLGLSLSRGLVEGMGGHIGYRAPVDAAGGSTDMRGGASYWITLPLADTGQRLLVDQAAA